MKTLTEHILLQLLESESPTNTTAGIAGSDSPFKTGKIAGHKYIEVDKDTYHKCKFGKKPYAKWDGYVDDEQLRNFIKKHYTNAKSLLIVNKESGNATFLRR